MTSVEEAGSLTRPVRAERPSSPTVTVPVGAAAASVGAVAPTVAAGAPRVTPALARRRLWERRYRARLRLTDAAVIAVVAALTTFLELILEAPALLARDPFVLARIPVVVAVTWIALLGVMHTRDEKITGSGTNEYKRVAHATGLAFGILAIAFVVFQWQGLRTQLLIALPLGLVGLLIARWGWRKWLLAKRRFGHYVSRAFVVGDRRDVAYVIESLGHDGQHGYLVLGTSLLDGDSDGDGDSAGIVVDGRRFPTVGTMSTVAQTASALGADAIIVASRPAADPDYVKHLAWQLEGTAAELVLSNGLADVAGPRISLRQVEGLPLVQVQIPSYEGGRHLLKRALDICVAALALIPIAVAMPVLAAAIKLDSRGPVFFRQERVGRDGRTFHMVKLRSMHTTAEQDLTILMTANEGSGPLFKLRNDPRVTRVGRFLRRYSLDELPQFWNVLAGEMSVVGPRPPLPNEVIAYDGTVYRRLYVKPGITGPWQVGGRSDLSWHESVRIDLRYVENWSVMNDLMIMWRTVKVMLQPKGAY